jgi:O-antigen/teichoic acid export membrane protein
VKQARRIKGFVGMVNRDVILTMGVRLLIILSGFGTSILTARFLGPGGRGDYFLATTIALTIVQFSNLGLHSSNTYLAAKDRALLRGLVANSFWVSLVGGGGVAVTVALVMQLGNWLTNTPLGYLWLAIALVPPTLFFMLGNNLLVGINRIDTFNGFQVGNNLVVLLFMGLAGWQGWGVQGFLGANVLAGCCMGAVLLVVLLRYSSEGEGLAFRREVFSAGFRYGIKVYVASLLAFLVLRSNVFLLKSLATTEEIGYFSVATQIADVLSVLPTSVAIVLFPNLVRSDAAGRWTTTLRSMGTVGGLMVVACAIAAILVEPFIRIAFGSGFLAAVPILLWMLPGVFFLSMSTVVSQYLAAIGFPKVLTGIWVIAFTIVAALSWFLVPLYSGAGAAMALSLTYGLLFLMILRLAWVMEQRLVSHFKSD